MKHKAIYHLTLTALLLGLGMQAQALTINQFNATTDSDSIGPAECDTTSNSAILACLDKYGSDGIEATPTDFISSDSVYTQNVGEGSDEGSLAGSYTTTFNNADPDSGVIEYNGGAVASGDPLWLLVKDGNANPSWYLFDLFNLGWNGTDDINLQCFWGISLITEQCDPSIRGAISHVEIFGGKGGETEVPEPGALGLLGAGLLGLGLARRRRKQAT